MTDESRTQFRQRAVELCSWDIRANSWTSFPKFWIRPC